MGIFSNKIGKEITNINITLPQSWQELDDDRLRFAYERMAAGAGERLPHLCLIKWAGWKVMGRGRKAGEWHLLDRATKAVYVLTAPVLAAAASNLDYLLSPPEHPVRMAAVGKAKALPCDFAGVKFEDFICCENLFQGAMMARDAADVLLADMAKIMYPGIKKRLISESVRLNCLYWFTGLKQYFGKVFSDFFKATNEENLLGSTTMTPKMVRDVMNSEIRALTKGDITKERLILEADTWRALAELDAQAREYKELKSKSK